MNLSYILKARYINVVVFLELLKLLWNGIRYIAEYFYCFKSYLIASLTFFLTADIGEKPIEHRIFLSILMVPAVKPHQKNLEQARANKLHPPF